MAAVAEIAWNVNGDIGGLGVSRFRFVRQDSASITGADCNAAAAATRLLINPAAPYIPSTISWVCNAEVKQYDVASGLVVPPLVITSLPAIVTGSGTSAHGAGLGARINWKTSTLAGRRLIKGAVFMVPFTGSAFGGDGSIPTSVQTTLNAGAAAYLTAMTTAVLYPVVWHRPHKGATSGGLTGIVFVGQTSSQPGGLRSRRS